MSRLKQYVKQKLQNRVGPDTLGNLDTHIFGAVMELQHDDLLPPKNFEFKSIDRKKEHRTEDGEFQFNYYSLPEDFQTLDEFHVYGTDPFFEAEGLNAILQHKKKSKLFAVVKNNFISDVQWDNILVAKPFPDDDSIVKIAYYVDGSDMNWDWIIPKYWNAILAQVQVDLGVAPQELADNRVSRVSYTDKNPTSKKKTKKRRIPTFFGNNRRW